MKKIKPNSRSGDLILLAASQRQMSLSELAALIGVSKHNLSNCVHGRRPIGYKLALKLWAALDLDINLLITLTPEEKKELDQIKKMTNKVA